MTRYAAYVHDPGGIAKAVRDGLTAAERGALIRTWWGGDGLDAEQLHAWFRDKLDQLINLKAGLRSDGASRRDRQRCRCRSCLHQHGHDLELGIERVAVANGYCRTCPLAHREWGGRKWGDDYQREQYRDCQRIHDKVRKRIVMHQIMTPELRARFAHLISSREDW